MPAPFVRDLCRYRENGKPNTSDASNALSVEIGEALFAILGVERTTEPVEDEPTGGVFARRVVEDLIEQVGHIDDLAVVPERRLYAFEQYRHVGALQELRQGSSVGFNRAWNRLAKYVRRTTPATNLEHVESLIAEVEAQSELQATRLKALVDELGDESLLGLDVTVSRTEDERFLPHLEVGLSLKWSLRTDRAQDCRSQGAKMSALRRGRMPHFAALTMEPRPYMLNLLGGGSGDVDCVYHLDLPSLTRAVEEVYVGSPQRLKGRDMFRRLVDQHRLKDYEDLVAYVGSV